MQIYLGVLKTSAIKNVTSSVLVWLVSQLRWKITMLTLRNLHGGPKIQALSLIKPLRLILRDFVKI